MRRPEQGNGETVEQWIREGARRFEGAGLHFGHDSSDALDEAAALVFHALRLDHAQAPAIYARCVDEDERARIEALFDRRIAERIPAAYLTGETRFAGVELAVDSRALVPRSPLAELLEAGFAPWLEPQRIEAILDLCTGGGCIAVAAALACAAARVDAVDLSAEALALASQNVHRHNLGHRVRLLQGDLFQPVSGRRYDVIVSNPPYVPDAEFERLPAEYLHEPRLGLAGGPDGLVLVRRILAGAREHLSPHGILIVEVGELAGAVEREYPRLPFVWLAFERGESDVLLLNATDLGGSAGESHDVR